jgi:hypothetical protein
MNAPRSVNVRWLDPPDFPPDGLISTVGAALVAHPNVTDAWLVRRLLIWDDGTEREDVALALAFEGDREPEHVALASMLADLMAHDAFIELGIRSVVTIPARLRPRAEQLGMHVYPTRLSPTDQRLG